MGLAARVASRYPGWAESNDGRKTLRFTLIELIHLNLIHSLMRI
jgi:hypothetical protein